MAASHQIAFRWGVEERPAAASDVVRVRNDGEVCLALLANGFDSGFSTCWPAGSRLILDLFEREWAAADGSPARRLEQAFERASLAFDEPATALVGADADFPDDTPAAILLAVALAGRRAEVAWISGDQALVVRAPDEFDRTTPHTIIEQLVRDHPGSEPPDSPFAQVLARTIGRSNEWAAPERATFDLRPGDTLALVSKSAFKSPRVPPRRLAGLVASAPSLERAAENIVQELWTNGRPPYAAAALLTLDLDSEPNAGG